MGARAIEQSTRDLGHSPSWNGTCFTQPVSQSEREANELGGHGRLRREGRALLALLALLALMTAALLCGCAALPPLDDRTPSSALPDTTPTRLGAGIAPAVAAHPGQCGILALADPRGAFAARVVLAAAATRSLDVQYYIWHDDTTGRLLLQALREAAERGVRVRLLIDDLYTAGEDE